jgi:hypothetical protein
MMPETCDKHDECLGRIHEKLNKIEVSNAKVDGFLTSINEFVKSINKDTYSKDGLMDRVGNHGTQIILQWGLLAAIIVAVIIGFMKR